MKVDSASIFVSESQIAEENQFAQHAEDDRETVCRCWRQTLKKDDLDIIGSCVPHGAGEFSTRLSC